jgi:hypothetical protein
MGVEAPLPYEAVEYKMARPGGVEPPASSSAGKRSIHLSYGRPTTLAERLGFEPRVDLSAYTRLAGARLRPLGHLSSLSIVKDTAEGEGFEPP